MNRNSDIQTVDNLSRVEENSKKFLNTPLTAQFVVENITNNVDKTAADILNAFDYFKRDVRTTKLKVLDSIFVIAI